MRKHVVTAVIVAVVLGAAGFFVGAKYGKTNALTPQAFASMSQTQRQQLLQSFRGGMMGGQGQNGGRRMFFGGGNGQGAFIGGQIISKDDKSITVKSQDGSTKIVFLSGSTQVAKTVSGAVTDLNQGEDVTVTGTPNQDGSVTAQMVVIRPQQPTQSQSQGQ